MKINLLEETRGILAENRVTLEDILFAIIDGEYLPAERFLQMAKDMDYDNGYGSEEVSLDLKVVGKTWWLERHEYEGSEWWEFKSRPRKPATESTLKTLKHLYSWNKEE